MTAANTASPVALSFKGLDRLDLSPSRVHRNLAPAKLVELALARGEGTMAANGGLVCLTGDRTGRSPKDKYLEDTAGVHSKIGWGGFNAPITPANFDKVLDLAVNHLNAAKDLFMFEGFVGADPHHVLFTRARRATEEHDAINAAIAKECAVIARAHAQFIAQTIDCLGCFTGNRACLR